MEIKRFALALRFDTFEDEVSEEQKQRILEELCSAIPLKIASKLKLFGGVFPLNDSDPKGVYTVVFTNGGLQKMRALYRAVEADAALRSQLCSRFPYLQNNVVRDFEDPEFIGCVKDDGAVADGTAKGLKFGRPDKSRPAFDPTNSIIVAPNSFKGTFSSSTAARHICRALRAKLPNTLLIPMPAADGGDGTLEAVERMLRGRKRTAEVTGPYGGKISAAYYSIDGRMAVIESALASGLAVCGDRELDPAQATSRGTGELILRALHEGLTDIYIGLGGSATNDCGVGAASALGFRFLNKDGAPVESAELMDTVFHIDDSAADPLIKKARFTLMCDVENPLTGKDGATYTYGPQKGASPEQLELLEKGMLNMASVLDNYCGRRVSKQPGSGAAGGMGAMFTALLGAEHRSGSNAILDIAGFDKLLKNAAFVVTGEGRLDSTSMQGKVVGAILSAAEAAHVRAGLICGSRGDGADEAEKHAVVSVFCNEEGDRLAALDSAAEELSEQIAKRYFSR